MTPADNLVELPEDRQALKSLVYALLRERDGERQRAEAQKQQAIEQTQRADGLYIENLRLQVELARLKMHIPITSSTSR